jgi:hypothetical protein
MDFRKVTPDTINYKMFKLVPFPFNEYSSSNDEIEQTAPISFGSVFRMMRENLCSILG